MLDIKILRENPEEVEKQLKTKDDTVQLQPLLSLDQELREKKTRVEEKKSTRNTFSKKIGQAKAKGEDTKELMREVSQFGAEIEQLDQDIRTIEEQFIDTLSRLPNLPDSDVLASPNAEDNIVMKQVGEKKDFPFPFKNHLELNEKLQLFDFERGAKLSGSGWPTYKGIGARLEWALINYMLSIQIKNGFTQWIPPLVVREDAVFGSGQLPKFADQQYKLPEDGHTMYLIPTAEVALNGLHMDEIIDEADLPLLYTAYTPCFRREAGAAGKGERGLIRIHQFNKVEMFAFSKPEESKEIFDKMIASAEEVLQGLGMHYRNMLLVTGDMSFPSARTVDIEVWLPGQERYYEVSSVSNCTDFQARRSKTRFRRKGGKPELLHTLNGSGLATSRLMVALLENNQNEDGSITIPEVLRPYLDGMEKITNQV